ncbi:MAG: hypothetical protein Q9200_005903 [Gallowayella weberi]
MAHRDRGSGRERGERDRFDERRREPREPVREPSFTPAPKGAALNEFFVDGEGIHREVMQRELCKFLGPDALSRPGSYNGQKGFIVTAVRPFTSKMIETLQSLSQDYEREKREMNSRGYKGSPMRASPSAALPNPSSDYPYSSSRTRERQEAVDPYEPYEQDPRYAPQGRYADMFPDQYPERYGDKYPEKYPEKYPDMYPEKYPDSRLPPGYVMPSGYPPGSGYPPSQASGYPSSTGYPASSGYPAGSGYPASSYPQGSNYPPTSGYPPSSGYVAPGYTATSSMPGGRNEPNYIYTDQPGEYPPSGYPYQPPNVYAGGPQANPRNAGAYPYVSSPQDPSLRGATMDDRSYEIYSQQIAASQPGRGGYPIPSRGTPTQHDPPQPRDGFGRAEPERRRR